MNVVSNRKLQTHSGVKIENFWADVNYRGQSGKCGHIYHNSQLAETRHWENCQLNCRQQTMIPFRTTDKDYKIVGYEETTS